VRLNNRTWELGPQIGKGGFGRVCEAYSGDISGAAKLIPKEPGSEREMLFVNLGRAKNVVPIIDSGENGDHWVLIMPRAARSLRDLMKGNGTLALTEVIRVLRDVAATLASISNVIVHRDIKPENILDLNGSWCLADFGIARYVESSTTANPNRFALSPPYAAPERWRNERGTGASDVYSLGVVAYELIAGAVPFTGPEVSDFREAHLYLSPPALTNAPASILSLIDECMYKHPEERPTPSNLLRRLDRIMAGNMSTGLHGLEAVNAIIVRKRSESYRAEEEAKERERRRTDLVRAANKSLRWLADMVLDQLSAVTSASYVEVAAKENQGVIFQLRLGGARLLIEGAKMTSDVQRTRPDGAEIICQSSIKVVDTSAPPFFGIAHPLWYANINQAEQFQWYEVPSSCGTHFKSRTENFIQKEYKSIRVPARRRSEENVAARRRSPPVIYSKIDFKVPVLTGPPDGNVFNAVYDKIDNLKLEYNFIPARENIDDFIGRWAIVFAFAARGELRKHVRRALDVTNPDNP
jgi:eukaryotic-like serine/threonine-protein kinase